MEEELCLPLRYAVWARARMAHPDYAVASRQETVWLPNDILDRH